LSNSVGNSFAYFSPGFGNSLCNGNSQGTTYTILQIPTKEMLSLFLSAQAQGKPIGMMYISNAAGPYYHPGVGTLTCTIYSADIKD
jgi:hypothetical protein